MRTLLVAAAVVTLGVLVAALVIWYADYGKSQWTPEARWLAILPYSVLVFGAVAYEFRSRWVQKSFWLLLLTLLAVYWLAWAALLWWVDEWRLVWFAPVSVAESVAIIALMARLGFDLKP